ncbi:MAG: cytochrome b5-like heme/steroid binding domain-containing protein [Enhygromyxa sp.]
MSRSRGIVLGAVLVFLLAWGVLAALALRSPPPSTSDAPAKPGPGLTLEEIARHDQPDDCWLIIRGKVYDVSSYIASHPAPRETITDYCGKESTRAFETKDRGRPHSPQAWNMLESYYVGEVFRAP